VPNLSTDRLLDEYRHIAIDYAPQTGVQTFGNPILRHDDQTPSSLRIGRSGELFRDSQRCPRHDVWTTGGSRAGTPATYVGVSKYLAGNNDTIMATVRILSISHHTVMENTANLLFKINDVLELTYARTNTNGKLSRVSRGSTIRPRPLFSTKFTSQHN
jgi:hypothetical protein